MAHDGRESGRTVDTGVQPPAISALSEVRMPRTTAKNIYVCIKIFDENPDNHAHEIEAMALSASSVSNSPAPCQDDLSLLTRPANL